ncbi:hypothetical protein ES692_05165 [Psychroserpens burtonensis]|uniref:Uncharacterized protein n=1 Tax=Psychroserpens burtonensis TaxID=49278 RepID=A0A5C7BC29_9FLAO|nr:hypothetical protein [Psychroserpens burtonensis]TXE18843.1 hypothetical protein ES692_05165 [Psychroserpens burtonensis]
MNYLNHELNDHNKRDVSKVITKLMFSLVVLGLTFASCSKDDTVAQEEQNEDISEVRLSSEIDKAASVVGDLIIDAYEGQELSDSNRLAEDQLRNGLPDCVTITVVAQQGFREVTVDFGTAGCVVNGHVFKGQIVFSYTRNPDAQHVLITYDLVDFFFDAKNIIGSKTLLKEWSNDDGNPQFTHTLEMTVIWPNGTQASREGLKIREWVEGFGSGVFSDNVFEVTGNWSTTFINGNTHSYQVITPLRREMICDYVVSGSVDVERTNFGGTFDYGNGNCDNQATFTFNNGTEIEVILN